MSQPRTSLPALAGLAGLAGLAVAAGCGFTPPIPAEMPREDAMPDTPADTPTDTPPDMPPMLERVTSGLVAFWKFDELSGDRANDTRMELVTMPAMSPIPLPIGDLSSVTWGGGGLALDAPVRVGTPGTAHVSRDVLATGEVTLEVWASPAMTSQGDGTLLGGLPNYALVFSISPSYAYHNAMIAQVGDRWQGRVLTEVTTSNAVPVIETPAGAIAGTEPVHLVLVASATERVLYVNGRAHRAPAPATGIGPLNAPPPAQRWFDYFPVSIGQERDTLTQKRPWLGTIWLAAIYDRALTEAQVLQNLGLRHDCTGC
jgi:hypothetical protein